MGFAIVMIVLLVAFIIFAIVAVSKGVAKQRREEEERAIAQRKRDIEVMDRRTKDLVDLAALANVDSRNRNIDDLARELCRKAKSVYESKLGAFCITNSIIGGIVDTHSVLSNCMVSPTTFYYGVTTDLGLTNKCTTSDLNTLRKIFSNNINIGEKYLPLDDILMFKLEGDKQFATETSGGGANLQGAVLGGLLFGGAAAIVGSQIGTEIKTTTKEIDSRLITLYYNYNGKLRAERITSIDYDKTVSALRQLIPQKEESVVQLASTKQKTTSAPEQTSASSVEKIKKFKELLDMGAITEEEYNAKKAQLLAETEVAPSTEQPKLQSNLCPNNSNTFTPTVNTVATDNIYNSVFNIDEVFEVAGLIVAFGKVMKGCICKSDNVTIRRQNGIILDANVMGIEKFREKLDKTYQGDEVGLVLRGISNKSDIQKGDIITK